MSDTRLAGTASRGMARGLTLLTMRREGVWRMGVKTSRGILDVPSTAAALGVHAPATIDDLLQAEDGPSLNALVDAASRSHDSGAVFLDEAAVEFGPVVTRPEKIIGVGLNYRRHATEIGKPVPSKPVLFAKFCNTLLGHRGTIRLPVESGTKFDYEVELVIVMGKTARNVAEADALSYVAGYCTGNDFSARDLQDLPDGQWLLGKTPDGFAPIGPYLVTADQVDPDDLALECRVNGEMRQHSSTSDLIFRSGQIISHISRSVTLKPGDVIFTGTPEGVIAGYPPGRQVWLKAGDTIACSVEGLGELTFRLT